MVESESYKSTILTNQLMPLGRLRVQDCCLHGLGGGGGLFRVLGFDVSEVPGLEEC